MSVLVSNITETSLEGNGSFDLFMTTLSLHIAKAIKSQQITQSQAGEIYVGVIPSMISEAVKLELGRDITNANIIKSEADADLARLNADIAYAKMLAEIDKVLGFDYTLDAEQNIVRSSLVDAGDGKIDAEVAKMTADAEIARAQADKAYAEMLASIDKVSGFSYTLDVNDDIVRSSLVDQADGRIDKENDLIDEKIQTEDINNRADGFLEKQILKVIEETKLATANELLTDRKVL